jgi:uncharacterized protein (DUF4213/DUF364 family)
MGVFEMKILLVVPVALLLSGCATKEQIQVVMTRCPIIKNYSKEKLEKAADELANLADSSELIEIISDYSKLRDACRIVSKKLKSM